MSKCNEIRDFCGDYAFDVEYSEDNEFTMFFNSRRNAETVKRCIEVDDSVPNVATAVDFVEVVRCKDCFYSEKTLSDECPKECSWCRKLCFVTHENHYCSYGERRANDATEKNT